MPEKIQTGAMVKGKTSGKVWLIVLACVMFAALLGTYFAVAQYYSDRFPARTTINHISVGGLSAASVKRKMNAEIQTYALTIEERGGGTETITAADIGLAFEDNGDVDKLLSQYNSYRWPLYMLRAENLTMTQDTTYSQEQAEKMVANLNCFDKLNYASPENACLVLTDTGVAVQKEVEGNQLDQEKTTQRLLQAIASGETTVNLEEEQLYLEPTIRSDNETLLQQEEKLNIWLNAELTFDFEDNRIMTVDRDLIYSWLEEDEKGVYHLNQDEVTEWVKTELAYKTDTFGLDHEFTTHSGETITLKQGDYGWCIAREDTAKKIIEAVEAGKVETMEPEYLYEAKFRGINDIGDSYIEVDLTNQKVYAYKDGDLLVESDVVTGCVAKGYDTPSGSVWAVDCHKSPAVLGTIETNGYSSPVTYWMSFTGNVGLHDADGWRSAYGGDIYINNGSHGCVNTPTAAMKIIYDNFNVGDPVIVHK